MGQDRHQFRTGRNEFASSSDTPPFHLYRGSAEKPLGRNCPSTNLFYRRGRIVTNLCLPQGGFALRKSEMIPTLLEMARLGFPSVGSPVLGDAENPSVGTASR